VEEETREPAFDPDTMETNVPGVYVAGVLAAGDDANRIFIENGRHHGRKIVAHLTEGREAAAAVETGVGASARRP
jgi:thioredoxin reductase (NADPH)